jgi:hypothetical protein
MCYEATFGGHERYLAKGEMGVVPLIAQDERATRVDFSYMKAYLTGSPLLRDLVAEEREREIWLTNGLRIMCFACTAKSLRGYSIPAAGLDEVAFFRLEGDASTDVEVQTSVRRGGVGFPMQRLIKITTPYAKGGLVWDDYSRYYGTDDPDVLVWQAPTALMNPTITDTRLARERRVDARRASREYDALFADDVEGFLPGVWLDAAVTEGVFERAPVAGVSYLAAVDPSGGGADSFTLCVLHLEEDRFVQDVMRGWGSSRSGTVDLAAVCGEIAALLRAYGVSEVIGDRYAGAWAPQEFARHGVAYRQIDRDKSRCYLDCEAAFAQGKVDLLDHPQMLREFRLLERRPRSGGRTVVDHPRGGHDDYPNAACLAIASAAEELGQPLQIYVHDFTPKDDGFAPGVHFFGA